MKAKRSFIVEVERKGVISYLVYRTQKGKGISISFVSRYENKKQNATTFNSYGKALAMLLTLDNEKEKDNHFKDDNYKILELDNTQRQ
jgi:hypothetical protein